MLKGRRPWREELEIIDRTMKAISGVTDPEELVEIYWNGIGELLPIEHYVTLSRRNIEPPSYLVTRSSRFTEQFNPWTQRERLPKLSGGILGEIAYAEKPVFIEDLPARLSADDPAWFYLQGFQGLISTPQYDNGEALNVSIMLLPPGMEIDPAVIPVLHWQSGLFGRGTQNLVLKNRLNATLQTLDRELQVVGEIQRSLLPSELPKIDGYELAAHYLTSARAGGDYYDFFPLADGAWGIFIADVSGHGTPAAVLMAITHALAHARPGTHTPPGELLKYLNDHLARAYTRNGTFITAFYAVLDPATRKLTYAMAGHNPPRLVRNGRVIPLDVNDALPLGIFDGQSHREASVTLEEGDLLVLYTDGITETGAPLQTGMVRELFGTNRLDELLLSCGDAPPADCIKCIQCAIDEFSQNAPAADDQSLIAIRCLASAR